MSHLGYEDQNSIRRRGRTWRWLILAVAVFTGASQSFAQAPANDDFANRTSATGVSFSAGGSTLNASKETGEADHAGSTGGASVWWTWQATGDGRVTIDLAGSDFDTLLAVYAGADLPSLVLRAANDDDSANNRNTSRIELDVLRNEVLQIAVDGHNGASGTVALSIDLTLSETAPLLISDVEDQTVFIPTNQLSLPVTFSASFYAHPPAAYEWTRDGINVTGATNETLSLVATTNDHLAAFQLLASNTIFFETSSVAVLRVVPASFNDNFAARIDIGAAGDRLATGEGNVTHYRGYGDASNATREAGEGNHAGFAGANSSWWTWTASQSGNVIVDTFGSSFDTLLAVYTGDTLGGLSLLVENDDLSTTASGVSSLSFAAIAGMTYQIAVDAKSSPGAIVMNLRHEVFNDSFADRKQITGQAIQSTANNGNATREPAEPALAGISTDKSLWWSWMAPSNGPVTVDTAGSDFDSVLGVFTGNDLGSLQVVSVNDDYASNTTSRVRFDAQAGQVFQFLIAGKGVGTNAASGQIVLNLRQGASFNDLFVDRVPVFGQSAIVVGANSLATDESGEPNHLPNAAGKTIWWSWVAPADGPTTIDTAGSDFDTILAVYVGARVDGLTLIENNNDHDAVRTSQVQFIAEAGVEYQIVVDGFSAATGAIRLELLQTQPQPAGGNDAFANRFIITGLSAQLSGVNTNATKEVGEPDHADNAGGKSLWWTWTATTNGIAVFTTVGSDFDTMIAAYTGDTISGLSFVGSDDDNGGNLSSRLTFLAESGRTYQLAVDGFRKEGSSVTTTAAGNVALNLAFTPGEVVVQNDYFTNRVAIVGTNATVIGSNIGASRESGEPSHASLDDGRSVWWSWTPTRNGPVTIDTLVARFDTVLAVYTGEQLGNLILVEEHDDIAQQDDETYDKSRVDFEAVAGVEYLIAVDGYLAAGDVAVRVQQDLDTPRGITIIRQPLDQIRFGTGQSGNRDAVFGVNALGSGPLAFQWQRNGVDLAEATNRWLVVTDPETATAGEYRAVVSNGASNVLSSGALLVVESHVFNDHFTNHTALSGLVATGRSAPRGAGREPGEPQHEERPLGNSLWWSWRAPADGLVRFDTIGSSFDTTLSVYRGADVASLSPVISNDDIDLDRGILLSGLLMTATQDEQYFIAVDGYKTNFANGTVILNISQPPAAPVVTSSLAARNLSPGATTLLSVAADGVHPISFYQWYRDSTLIAGATNRNLTLFDLQRAQSGAYNVTVSNTMGGFTNVPIAILGVIEPQLLRAPVILSNGFVRLRFRDLGGSATTDFSRLEVHSTDNPGGPNVLWLTNTANISRDGEYLMFEEDGAGRNQRFFRVVEREVSLP